jgi:ribonucleotide reductase class II
MSCEFPVSAPAAHPVFFRTYSRSTADGRESWEQVVQRTQHDLAELGQLEPAELQQLQQMQQQMKVLPSGRWLWVGGTPWIQQPQNFSGAYNCTSTNLVDWQAFGLMMDLAMMGSGTGAVLEPGCINQLPPIVNRLEVELLRGIGAEPAAERCPDTVITAEQDPEGGFSKVLISVGDSRRGWVDSYQLLLQLASDTALRDPSAEPLQVQIDLGHVRPAGERLSGFGGVSNPIKLPELYGRVAAITNRAVGRQLTAVECCLLIDEAALVVVAGNVRRSAGMRQFASDDLEAAAAKDNLWQQDEAGNWRMDPERDALRMANHTRVFHHRPEFETVLASVRKQFTSGEGAIQFAPEALARANADILSNAAAHRHFIRLYCTEGPAAAGDYLKMRAPGLGAAELEHRLQRYGLNPCGEIIGADFHCNLAEVHLNLLDPADADGQDAAFAAAALTVATLLNHRFSEARYRNSRELDPIVGVSFTGLFDFFVHAFGLPWLQWWEAGRPDTEAGRAFKAQEAAHLARWKQVVEDTVAAYCQRQGLKCPNRCTTVQPAGTKSLLTGASPGWHPPKAQRFIRRITFRKNDPVALACMDYGYTIVPSQSDKDERGQLLDDPFDPRCTEWLVEIPTEVSWANIPGADAVEINNFSALAQFDFYMQVQQHYTAHNTSATIEYREDEIEPLAWAIHNAIQQDAGYISAALLARFDANATFPRLPFEPIDAATYQQLSAAVLQRREVEDFFVALQRHDSGIREEAGPAGCDSDKCLLPLAQPAAEVAA